MYLFRGQTSNVFGYPTEHAIRLILPMSEESPEFFLNLKIGIFSLYPLLMGRMQTRAGYRLSWDGTVFQLFNTRRGAPFYIL
jgi:hypothetical protein